MAQEDLIYLKVKERMPDGTLKEFEYGLEYEDFAAMKPLLDSCKHKKEVLPSPEDPASLASVFNAFMGKDPNSRKGIIYNLSERPTDYTIEQVVEFYHKHNVLLVKSDKTNTTQIL